MKTLALFQLIITIRDFRLGGKEKIPLRLSLIQLSLKKKLLCEACQQLTPGKLDASLGKIGYSHHPLQNLCCLKGSFPTLCLFRKLYKKCEVSIS